MEWSSIIMVMFLCANGALGHCPSLCSCNNNKSKEGTLSESLPAEPLRLKCGGDGTQITELKEIDLDRLSTSIVSLNLSGNAISILSRELNLPNLQKLDISKNQISLIEPDAFYNMTGLQRLYLSSNQISNLDKNMFKGLVNLEKLVLAQNHISVLEAGTFDYLIGIKQIDLSENPLICDCNLLWLSDWSRNTSVKVFGKCMFPENMVNKTIRKLNTSLNPAICGTAPNTLIVKPSHGQVVFEGDTLSLSCNAPFATLSTKYELKWMHPMLEICDVNITDTDMQEEGQAVTTVYFPNITDHHMGNWTCIYSDQNHIRQSYVVEVVVLSNMTKYCLTNHTEDNKGLYSWPQILLNHTAVVPCRSGEGVARRHCNGNATWSQANTTECSYISNVTKLLQQFALLNVSLVQYSALNATERLAMLIQEKTYPFVEIADPDDVMFIAKAVRNYMHYIHEERDLGSSLLDVISSAMNISASVMARAETQYGASTDLLRAVEDISPYIHNVQGQKKKLAVERFPVREGFSGVTCVWYASAGPAAEAEAGGAPLRLHCTTTNRTVAPLLTVSDALIHASVQIPQSLLYSTRESGEPLQPLQPLHSLQPPAPAELVVSAYADAALFPLLPLPGNEERQRTHRAKDYYGRSTKREDINMEITSPVVGFQLRNVSLRGPLLEPVIVTLRARGAGGGAVRAAVWEPLQRRWRDNSTECRVSHVLAELVILSCERLVYVGLLQDVETGIYGARTDGARFKVSHPAVYVGSLILIGCVSCAALTYGACFAGVAMPARAKHAHLNTWAAMGLLCLLYTLGIYQTEELRLCQVLGLLIHYLSLCCLLWMCVSATNMYKWLTKTARPVTTPEEEAPPAPKPILGLYLVGWGISLIVCGISGAVNIKDYAGYSQCFLSTAPALSALFVPGGILLVFLMILFLLIRCTIRGTTTQLSEGTQATENVDLELWETSPAPERRSVKSALDSETEDTEHSPVVQLRAQVIVLCLYVAVWTCGAVAVYRPLPAYLPYQEDICSIIYAVCATVLGTFILFFYGIARSDVRAQWAAMSCYFERSKQCCRNRSVFDSTQSPAAAAPLSRPVPDDNRSRSGSRSSNRTNSKTTNAHKAGAELNGHTLPKDPLKNTNTKTPNMNLVVLHRQQYRSNNSMMTCPENGTLGPELFYNPNQMNVAKKFFKKQRQHTKRNRLELPTRRDCDNDSHVSLPLPTREAYGGVANIINAGSKVNNTNIHVERSNNGIKETRHALNPNLLEEEPRDHKNYSTDRKSWSKNDDPKSRAQVMNIYTNVPETRVPRHQVGRPPAPKTFSAERGSVSEECLRSPIETRTVSQQCSLECSSASDAPIPHTCSDQTINTPSELTSCQETQSALCSTNEITDTESFGQYIDYLQPTKNKEENKDHIDKSLQDISEECTMNSDEANRSSTPRRSEEVDPGELDELLQRDDLGGSKDKIDDDKDTFFLAKTTYDFDACSTNASEQGFENESDIYCPNYQMSEVSIRSHGLYAPSPSSMCPNEISFSNEDVSAVESQYVNYDPGWRKTIESDAKLGKYVPTPAVSCPHVNCDSPVSFASELDELYTQITRRERHAAPPREPLDVTANSDVTLKPTDSDSCVSEAVSEVAVNSETAV